MTRSYLALEPSELLQVTGNRKVFWDLGLIILRLSRENI